MVVRTEGENTTCNRSILDSKLLQLHDAPLLKRRETFEHIHKSERLLQPRSRVCDVFDGEEILLAGTRHFRSLTLECACLLS
jgi:hypothetical protein